jgi:hypothetical protein
MKKLLVVLFAVVFASSQAACQGGRQQNTPLTKNWRLPLIGAYPGLNWGIILNAFRKMTMINGENMTRKIILRIIAFAVAAFGVYRLTGICFQNRFSAFPLTTGWRNTPPFCFSRRCFQLWGRMFLSPIMR